MVNEEQKEPELFLNLMDNDAQLNIVNLDNKLEAMATEVQQKLAVITENEAIATPLHTLLQEIEKARQSIRGLVSMVLEDGMTKESFQQENKEQLEQFNDVILQAMQNIDAVKQRFDDMQNPE
ncbi:hypothetical protein Lbir_3043 [Legionella birminghamensis]|uniref:Uncharacterized protein n=1 Tax=Legionella birminghamensis TaxID=28083 RepID=A0A378IDF3_9GAMM|nr:hypothetical protein [Legionella birminghamensis]KTC66741.1 hypothetical protein Lbir_3043 [Legionella birminghamensis]STX32890.1 Uncharacterised protein [Legionella birminghamensis]